MTDQLAPQAALLRAFAVDFLTAHNPAAAPRVFAEDYCLSISGARLAGRDDAYLPATVAQLNLFPGLCVTAHDVVIGETAVALRFTEHGVSAREQRGSSWGGITLFRLSGGRLQEGWAEEDYYARKLQLRSGEVNPIERPHPAPWDQPALPGDSATHEAAGAFLADPANVLCPTDEISAGGPLLGSLVKPTGIATSMLFTAGSRAAFHAVVEGLYRGGFDELSGEGEGQNVSLPVTGILDVEGGAVTRTQICGDRLGLLRRLQSSLG